MRSGTRSRPGSSAGTGRRAVERFIQRLYRAAKDEDPEGLVGYANFPSTEYLHLPFLDFVAFNVFLEERDTFAAYVARLQTIAGDRPLVITELGLDSRRNGPDAQARAVADQVTTAFGAGCAGCFVFAWTDEWARNGRQVEDWDFGMVDRAREPKPGLSALSAAFHADAPVQPDGLPRVSVVVCSYNGSRTIGGCVRALCELEYPDYELIVVDDGSTDGTARIARGLGARVITTGNRGLSSARNTGIAAADGEIVAFCDDDCRPDPDWLRYLVHTFRSGDFAGVGGPNIPPPSTMIADAVGRAPGEPTHVLLSPTIAEHIPGCNMAFRRALLEEIEGFDVRFRTAGDDVDMCWRIQDAGGVLGFSPGAVVWHQPRTSVRGYVRQQLGYGRAEALLERKWPERYNGTGHLDWSGVIHGGKPRRSFFRRHWKVYYGRGGNSLFQSVYSRHSGDPSSFPLAPEWHLIVGALALIASFSLIGEPLMPLAGVPLAVAALICCLALMGLQAGAWSAAVVLPPAMRRTRRFGIYGLLFCLCLLQPLARLAGRTHRGLTPWRLRCTQAFAIPLPRVTSVWSDNWASVETWLHRVEHGVADAGGKALRGTAFDTWDLEVSVGPLAVARLGIVAEEHGEGRQLIRVRTCPRPTPLAAGTVAMIAGVCAAAIAELHWVAVALLASGCAWLCGRLIAQAGMATAIAARTLANLDGASLLPSTAAAPAVPRSEPQELPLLTQTVGVTKEPSVRVGRPCPLAGRDLRRRCHPVQRLVVQAGLERRPVQRGGDLVVVLDRLFQGPSRLLLVLRPPIGELRRDVEPPTDASQRFRRSGGTGLAEELGVLELEIVLIAGEAGPDELILGAAQRERRQRLGRVEVDARIFLRRTVRVLLLVPTRATDDRLVERLPALRKLRLHFGEPVAQVIRASQVQDPDPLLLQQREQERLLADEPPVLHHVVRGVVFDVDQHVTLVGEGAKVLQEIEEQRSLVGGRDHRAEVPACACDKVIGPVRVHFQLPVRGRLIVEHLRHAEDVRMRREYRSQRIRSAPLSGEENNEVASGHRACKSSGPPAVERALSRHTDANRLRFRVQGEHLNAWCAVPGSPFSDQLVLLPNGPEEPPPVVRYAPLDATPIDALTALIVSAADPPHANRLGVRLAVETPGGEVLAEQRHDFACGERAPLTVRYPATDDPLRLTLEASFAHFEAGPAFGSVRMRYLVAYVDSELMRLFNATGSDKGSEIYWGEGVPHLYALLYDPLLSSLRSERFDLLEIGLDTASQRTGTPADAPSLRAWREFFPHATLHGFDTNDFSFLGLRNTRTFQGDQASPEDLRRFVEAHGRPAFRIVIDDGSHVPAHQQISLAHLFECVTPGGLYAIEDISWQPFAQSPTTGEVLRAFLECGRIESPFIAPAAARRLEAEIDAVSIHRPNDSEVAVIRKRSP